MKLISLTLKSFDCQLSHVHCFNVFKILVENEKSIGVELQPYIKACIKFGKDPNETLVCVIQTKKSLRRKGISPDSLLSILLQSVRQGKNICTVDYWSFFSVLFGIWSHISPIWAGCLSTCDFNKHIRIVSCTRIEHVQMRWEIPTHRREHTSCRWST